MQAPSATAFGLVAAVAAGAVFAQQAAPVRTITADRAPLVREIDATGSLTSPRRSRLAPEVAGRVTAIEVDAGDRVTPGERLLALDAELAQLELEQAAAAKRAAVAELDDARRRLREGKDLVERGGIGRSELASRRAEVQRLQAVLARREAERGYQRSLVERHRLEAPFDGVIERRMIAPGERASPDRPVLELIAIERLRLDLGVDQRHFTAVEAGTPIRVHFEARPDRPIDTEVDTVVPVTNPDSRTFRVRVALANDDRSLTPGMSARATLRIDTGREGVVIPRDALLRQPNGRNVVWVLERDGDRATVAERAVEPGLTFDGRVAIRAGLEAGATVVTEGNEALQSGQPVRVTGEQ